MKRIDVRRSSFWCAGMEQMFVMDMPRTQEPGRELSETAARKEWEVGCRTKRSGAVWRACCSSKSALVKLHVCKSALPSGAAREHSSGPGAVLLQQT
jgi:hypothetical protein